MTEAYQCEGKQVGWSNAAKEICVLLLGGSHPKCRVLCPVFLLLDKVITTVSPSNLLHIIAILA